MTSFLIVLPFILTCVLVTFYAERKIAAFMQDRLGPTHVGMYGSLQAIADLLKLIQKEDIIPAKADKFLFKMAPIFIFLAIFVAFAVVPITSGFEGAGVETGVMFLMAIVSLEIIGLLMAGWASNNKYALFGSMRALAQIISYEIPFGLSVLSVIIINQTLDLQQISYQQSIINSTNQNYISGGFLCWNIAQTPHLILSYIVFFIATLAACNRAPFDMPEAESELVAGFHVEYSGFRFAIFFLAEYAIMLLVSLLGAILFFGAWNTPLPNIGVVRLADWTTGTPYQISGHIWGGFWLVSKAFLALLIQIWIRWTFPRLRIDQLMSLCWKILTPLALLMVAASAVWKLLVLS